MPESISHLALSNHTGEVHTSLDKVASSDQAAIAGTNDNGFVDVNVLSMVQLRLRCDDGIRGEARSKTITFVVLMAIGRQSSIIGSHLDQLVLGSEQLGVQREAFERRASPL
jgi:hypothetical protein